MQGQMMMSVAGETFPVWFMPDESKTVEEAQVRTVTSSFIIRPVDYERAHNAISIANRDSLGLELRAPSKEEICEKPQ